MNKPGFDSEFLMDLLLGVFLFLYYLFFDFSKIYTVKINLQIWPPVISSTGGKNIPPDEPAVGEL